MTVFSLRVSRLDWNDTGRGRGVGSGLLAKLGSVQFQECSHSKTVDLTATLSFHISHSGRFLYNTLPPPAVVSLAKFLVQKITTGIYFSLAGKEIILVYFN